MRGSLAVISRDLTRHADDWQIRLILLSLFVFEIWRHGVENVWVFSSLCCTDHEHVSDMIDFIFILHTMILFGLFTGYFSLSSMNYLFNGFMTLQMVFGVVVFLSHALLYVLESGLISF